MNAEVTSLCSGRLRCGWWLVPVVVAFAAGWFFVGFFFFFALGRCCVSFLVRFGFCLFFD